MLSHGKRLDNTQTIYQIFFSCDVTQYTFSHERVVHVVQTGSVFYEDGLCGWCCVISGLSAVSVVTCWRNNYSMCFCGSRNLQFFVEIFRFRISSWKLAVLIGVMWFSTVLRGKQWGTDKWAWPFINVCFLIRHSPSSYLSTHWDRACVIQSALD